MHACIHTNTYEYVYVSICVCVCVWCLYVYELMCYLLCMRAIGVICVYACVCLCVVNIYIYVYININVLCAVRVRNQYHGGVTMYAYIRAVTACHSWSVIQSQSPISISDLNLNLVGLLSRKAIGCLIYIGRFPQKRPMISGSFAERDLHKASSGSLVNKWQQRPRSTTENQYMVQHIAF